MNEEIETLSANEDTIPEEAEHAEATEAESGADTPQPAADPETENTSEEGGEPQENGEHAAEFSLPITFNHEERTLGLDEAKKYAQLGMKLENSGLDISSAKPIIHKLEYIASQNGMDAGQFIDGILEAQEKNYRESLIDRFGDDSETVDDMMELWKNKSREKYDRMIADRDAADAEQRHNEKESLEQRLADEYAELKAEIPELPSFPELPDEVKRAAAAGKNLTGAYLLYEHNRAARIKQEKEQSRRNAERSAGSLGTAYGDTRSAADEAFMRGIFGK